MSVISLSFFHRLAESCSHIGALLFYVEMGNRINNVTCTGEACKWVMPTAVKNVSVFASQFEVFK